MSEHRNTGGPAFPIMSVDAVLAEGMSLREYYAGQALVGALSNQTYVSAMLKFARDHGQHSSEAIASACVDQADDLIAELERTEQKGGDG